MLKDKQCQSAKPGMYADGDGLYLRVSPKGKRSWVRRSRVGGKDVWKTLGTYPRMTLKQARTLGINDLSISEAIKNYLSKISVRRPAQVELLLQPLLTQEIVSSRVELVKLLQLRAMTAPVLANRMLTRWQDFFGFCQQQGWIDTNPLTGVKRKFIGGKETARGRVLSWEELESAFHLVLTPSTKLALYFILATGLRPSEALWVLRVKRLDQIPTKEHHDPAIHKVPAVPHVKAILKHVDTVPSSHLTLSNALRRKKCGFTPHDLRRTFATRLADLGVAPHVIEKLLDHKMQGMMATYNRAEYWNERVAAMRLWGHKLSALRRSSRKQTASP